MAKKSWTNKHFHIMDELTGLDEADFVGVEEPDDGMLMTNSDSEVLRYRASIQSEVDSFIKKSKKLERLSAAKGQLSSGAQELKLEMEQARDQLDEKSRVRVSSYTLEWEDKVLGLDIRQTGSPHGGFGGLVWGSALLLSKYFLDNTELIKGKRCIELGAGCGLTGLFLAHLCSELVLTDWTAEVIGNLKYNVQQNTKQNPETGNSDSSANSCSDKGASESTPPVSMPSKRFAEAPVSKRFAEAESVKVEKVDWKDTTVAERLGQFDVILGAECVFVSDVGIVRAFVETISRLLRPGAVFYGVSPVDRLGFLSFIHCALQAGLEMRTVGLEDYQHIIDTAEVQKDDDAAGKGASASAGGRGGGDCAYDRDAKYVLYTLTKKSE